MLRAPWLFVLLFVTTVSCCAQPLPERREISGRVSMTQNKPILGAQVVVKRKEAQGIGVFWGAAVASNIAGEWSVPHAEEGDYIVEVSAPGYETWTSDYTLKPYSPPLRIVLQRKVTLTLALFDADGQPVRGRRAAVFGYITKAGDWQSANVPGAFLGITPLSNSKGICALSNLSEGVYHRLYISVRGVGYAVWPGKVQILEGGTHHIELQLQKAPASLRIKVLESAENGQEQPIGMADLYQHAIKMTDEKDNALARWLFSENITQTSDGDGALHLTDLLPGRYTLSVAAPRCSENLAKVRQTPELTVELTAETEKELALRLPPCPFNTPRLEIVLHDERGRPVANREFRLSGQNFHEETGLRLSPQEAQERNLPVFTIRRAHTDENGKVRLYPFWAGTWRLTVTELDVDVPFHGEATIKVTPEGAVGTIKVSLRPIEEAE